MATTKALFRRKKQHKMLFAVGKFEDEQVEFYETNKSGFLKETCYGYESFIFCAYSRYC